MKKSITRNIVRICALLLCCFALFALAGVAAYAADDASDAQKSEAGEAQFTGENILNTLISLRENGGLVTENFGEKATVLLSDGTTGTSYWIPWVPYSLTILLMIVFSYLMGSLNFGVIISKKLYKEDVRTHGSGNAGMTNVLRVYGKKAAVLTFLGDFLKGTLCAFLGSLLAGNGCGYIALAFCMIGHAFPVFFKFKGGKAVAATFGGIAALEPLAALILFVIFAIIVLGTKYVSLGSIIAAALIPLVVNMFWRIGFMHRPASFDFAIVIICTVFYACFIVWLHRANVKRLYEGKENKTYFIKKKEKKEQ